MHEPATMNLTIYQGATFDHVHTCHDEDGTPLDLTDYIPRMQARATPDAETAILDLDADTITLGGTTGTVTITIPASATTLLPPGDWVYDMTATNGAHVMRCMSGTLTISPAVTR